MELRCEVCGLRERAKIEPNSLIVRTWRWHTTRCPGWNAYQEELAKRQAAAGVEPSKTA